MTLEAIADRLATLGCRVRWRPDRLEADCPNHRTRRGRALSVTATSGGRMLVRCFAGCSFDEVAAALGVEARDLAPYPTIKLGSNNETLTASPENSADGQPSSALEPFSSLPRGNAPFSWAVSTAAFRPSNDDLLAAFGSRVVQPISLELSLPPRAGRVMREVAADLELIFGLRLAVGLRGRTPYAQRWGAERIAEDPSHVGRALRALAKGGAVVYAGRLEPTEPRRRGTRTIRLPSDLVRRLDLPTQPSALEARFRVAAARSRQPGLHLHDGAAVPVAELACGVRGEVRDRGLPAESGGAGSEVVNRRHDGSPAPNATQLGGWPPLAARDGRPAGTGRKRAAGERGSR